jgi:hypothetical protein
VHINKICKCHRIVWRLIWYKVLYITILLLFVWNSDDYFTQENYYSKVGFMPGVSGGIQRYFSTWDTAHYLSISEYGYKKDSPSCAFYPLWPLTARAFSLITGYNQLLSGLILANILSLLGMIIFFIKIREQYTYEVAKYAVVYIITFPGSLFYQFHYTESMFLFLIMVLWYSLDKKQYIIAWIVSFLLPATRAIGLFCLLPITWHLLTKEPSKYMVRMIKTIPWIYLKEDIKSNVTKMTHVECREYTLESSNDKSKRLGSWWLLCAPIAGWGCYLAYMGVTTGNPLEGFDAQRYWGVQSIGNIFDIRKFVVGFLEPTTWHGFRGSVLDRCSFIMLLYCLPTLWKLDIGLFIWTIVLGVVPAMSGTFTSFIRFESVVFPLFIALGVVLSKPECRTIRWAVVSMFVALHITLLWRFVNYGWAG